MTRSPFPGMDPYLEDHWRDVHTSLMTYIRDQIQEQLPFDLVARVEESVSVDADGDEGRLVAPDVSIVEDGDVASFGFSSASAVALAEPLMVLEEEPQTARHVRILDLSSGERVVTVIEVLSPSNKATALGRRDYWRKQQDYLNSGVNLVEIDLLRCGQYVLATELERLPEHRRRTYMMSVRTRTRTILFGASIREALPTIAIPLRPIDQDVTLAIQTLIDQVYERGRYGRLNYQVEPSQPLASEDATWCDELLRQHGRRK